VIKPTDALLAEYAPLSVWREAESQAARSPFKRQKTGAVIFNNVGRKLDIMSTGCSHPHDGGRKVRSIHAEQHAIARLNYVKWGHTCLIVTITAGENYANCSRPCEWCARAIKSVCNWVVYAERCNDGSWAIRREDCDKLVKGFLKPTKVTV
jgi:deoxycytidylate deaminase